MDSKENIIVKRTEDNFIVTSESNYKSYISDERKMLYFDKVNGFESVQDVTDYLIQFLNIDKENNYNN